MQQVKILHPVVATALPATHVVASDHLKGDMSVSIISRLKCCSSAPGFRNLKLYEKLQRRSCLTTANIGLTWDV